MLKKEVNITHKTKLKTCSSYTEEEAEEEEAEEEEEEEEAEEEEEEAEEEEEEEEEAEEEEAEEEEPEEEEAETLPEADGLGLPFLHIHSGHWSTNSQ